jgi:hypothetical protein
MTRDELIAATRGLIDEGERLRRDPSLGSLQVWLQRSDDLLRTAWGNMDRYHLAWLMVGKPKGIVRGRPMTLDEEADYVREVASQKTAALRMSLDAAERQRMPFVGESGGVGFGGGSSGAGDRSAAADSERATAATDDEKRAHPNAAGLDRPPDRAGLPLEPGLAERLADARRRAAEHFDHDAPRAPRPEKMQR